MSDRTVYINITNQSQIRLTKATFSNPHGSEPMVVDGGFPLDFGKTLTIKLEGNNGINGSYTLCSEDEEIKFSFNYEFEKSKDKGSISLPWEGTKYQCWPDENPCEGRNANVGVNLYESIGVCQRNGNSVGLYVVPLAENPYQQLNNCQDLVNSVFGPGVRHVSMPSFYDQANSCPYIPADFTGGQVAGPSKSSGTKGRLVQTLLKAWNGPVTADGVSDYKILNFLARYLVPEREAEPFVMYVPNISYSNEVGRLPAYKITGYTAFGLAGDENGGFNMKNIEKFLILLCSGAHFVAISAQKDYDNFGSGITNPKRDLHQLLLDSKLPLRHDPGNSHYAGEVNETSYYYGSVDGNYAPKGCNLLLSLVFGKTVNKEDAAPLSYNTFMQLEGWQAEVGDNSRHKADFTTYQDSLWNISTFGACPYSEKRGTTIFLAPATWEPTCYQVTMMMPYVGAYAKDKKNPIPQSWLNTDVVSSPEARDLPSKYID